MYTPINYTNLTDAIAGFIEDANRVDIYVNGDETQSYISRGGVEVPSIRKFIASQQVAFDDNFIGVLSYFQSLAPPPLWTVPDGLIRLRASYPRLWQRVQDLNMVVSEATWPNFNAMYSSGDGVTTFRMPNLLGVFIRGLDNGRGLDPSRALGNFQQGTHITGDQDAVNTVDSANNILTMNIDPPDGTTKMINFTGPGSVSVVSRSTTHLGRVRPVNSSQLPCIYAGN